jgi:two-component system, NtrC family, response regulator AtoC
VNGSDTPLFDGSPSMQAIGKIVDTVADTDATVLIRGESGVGKDLIARALHAASRRRAGPFVKVNSAAIPGGLLESELFGHERGAFTGADRRKPGQFEFAGQGTLYLDEVAELPLTLQAKLLHVLQDFQFVRVGGDRTITVDVRVIAATNVDLDDAMAQSRFRRDLYYRLNMVEIRVPPLRERPEEIPVLAAWFVDKFNTRYQRRARLTPQTLARLQSYRWPGNIRELENAMRRLVMFDDADRALVGVDARDRAGLDGVVAASSEGLREIARRGARDAGRRALADVLERVRWNRAEASRILKVSYKTLLNRVAEFGLAPPEQRGSM